VTCVKHPERESTVTCHGCGQAFCDACVVKFEKLSLCESCKSKFLVDVDERPSTPRRAIPPSVARAGAQAAAAQDAARRSDPDAQATIASGLRPSRRATWPWIGGSVALAFALVFVFVMIGALAKKYGAWREDQTVTDAYRDLATIGSALERYHADAGTYPDGLATLVPKYLADVPRDPFGGAFHYEKIRGAWKLWSVGPDHKDDRAAPGDIVYAVEPGA
jgi:hypothetical protein